MKDTQKQQVAIKENLLWKARRFFRLPRLYVALMESKDKSRALVMWGFDKNGGQFAMDRFEVEEKEKVETYFCEDKDVLSLLKMFIKAL